MTSPSVQDEASPGRLRFGSDGLTGGAGSFGSGEAVLFRFTTAEGRSDVQSIFLLHHSSTAAPKTTATDIRAKKPPKPVNKNAQSSCMHH